MSRLDRAFVKAYSRNQSKPASSEGIAAPHFVDERNQHSVAREFLSDEPSASVPMSQGDLLDESYFRVDVGHTPIIRAIRVPRSALTNRSAESPAPPASPTHDLEPKAGGKAASAPSIDGSSVDHQMNPAAISHTLTAYAQPTDTSFVRVDGSNVGYRRTSSFEQEQPILRRVNLDVDEAQAFAVAKAQAYARERQAELDREIIAEQQLAAAQQGKEEDQKQAEAKWFSEKTLAEQKLAELRVAERKLAELKAAEQQLEALKQAEQDRIQRELEELKLANQRLAELRQAEREAADQRLAEQKLAADEPIVAESAESKTNSVASALIEKLKQKRNSPFSPVWEVDAFEFSDTIVELFSNSQLIKSIGGPLDNAVANGLKSILITSAERGVGRTSVAIGIAVSAAAAGLRVVLVDADITRGGLADAMHLEVQADWLDATRDGLPLDEVTIRSIEDQLAIVPAIAANGNVTCSVEQFDDMIETLRDAYDLVIVDSSPWFESELPITESSTVDAAIVVVDVTKPNPSLVNQVQNNLRHTGIAGLGIVENFG